MSQPSGSNLSPLTSFKVLIEQSNSVLTNAQDSWLHQRERIKTISVTMKEIYIIIYAGHEGRLRGCFFTDILPIDIKYHACCVDFKLNFNKFYEFLKLVTGESIYTTPFIQIQQTRKGLPNADINNCIAGIHKVRKHKQTAFKLFLYKMCLCRADAKWFILRMV